MKNIVLETLCILFIGSQVFALTPFFDGILDEWTGSGIVNLGVQTAPEGGNYTVLAAWDESNLYFGVDRDSSDRYLGDTSWNNDSFFIAIDTDGISGSGGDKDYYDFGNGRMDFDGPMLPDVIYYYAGGNGWYHYTTWNGSSWDDNPWSNAGTYYGWQEDNPDDELAIPLANIGGTPEVMVWAWMTREQNNYIEASWPGGYTGDDPNPVMGEGITIPEPATMALFGLGSLIMASICCKN